MPRWDAWLAGLADVLGPLLLTVPPNLGSRRPRDLAETLRLAWRHRNLGVRTIADVTRLMTMSIADLLDDWFTSPQVKGALAVNGVIGTWAGPYEPGTAYVMAHHSIGDVGDGHLGTAMLEARSIALVGASARPGRLGARMIAEVARSPSRPRTYLVNGRTQGRPFGRHLRQCLPPRAAGPAGHDGRVGRVGRVGRDGGVRGRVHGVRERGQGPAGHRVRRARPAARAGGADHPLGFGVLRDAAGPPRLRLQPGRLVRPGARHHRRGLRRVRAGAGGDQGARAGARGDQGRARPAGGPRPGPGGGRAGGAAQRGRVRRRAGHGVGPFRRAPAAGRTASPAIPAPRSCSTCSATTASGPCAPAPPRPAPRPSPPPPRSATRSCSRPTSRASPTSRTSAGSASPSAIPPPSPPPTTRWLPAWAPAPWSARRPPQVPNWPWARPATPPSARCSWSAPATPSWLGVDKPGRRCYRMVLALRPGAVTLRQRSRREAPSRSARAPRPRSSTCGTSRCWCPGRRCRACRVPTTRPQARC